MLFLILYWTHLRSEVRAPIRTIVMVVPSNCPSIHLRTAASPYLCNCSQAERFSRNPASDLCGLPIQLLRTWLALINPAHNES
jgi:hypothetical protein